MRTEPARRQRALVVDDDPDMRELLAFELNRMGLHVDMAQDGVEALNRLLSGGIDLVLTDVRMPRKCGLELLDDVRRALGASPPVLFMSGFIDMQLWEAYDRGVDGLIAKPFSMAMVRQTILRVLSPPEERWHVDPGPIQHTFRCDALTSASFRLGRGGAYIEASPQGYGRDHLVAFHLRGAAPGVVIDGKGIVRWSRADPSGLPGGIGIEFVYLTPESRAATIQLLAREPPTSFIPAGLQTGLSL